MPQPLEKPVMTAEDYWALPEGARAELIDGELWDLAAPSRAHQEIVQELSRGFGNFIAEQGGPCKVYPAPFAVNLFGDDSAFVEPDVSVVCDRSKLSDRGCEGAPDLVVEVVSPSNPGMDYSTKLNLYQEAGVREYWICDPQEERTLAYDLAADAGIAVAIHPFSDPVASIVLPGFSITLAEVIGAL